MKPWVAERMKTFLPQLEPLTLADEERIAALCQAEIQAWRDRPGLKSLFSLKEPLKYARHAVEALPLTAENSYVNRKGVAEHIALKHLTLPKEEWDAMNRSSVKKNHQRLTHQLMIFQPDEIEARIERLLQSHYWEELAAGLCAATGRRISEVLKYGSFREKSLYSVLFCGQRKSDLVDEYEIVTLVSGALVVAAWQRLRATRDFSSVEDHRLSSSFGPAVKAVVVKEFADLVEKPEDRSELYTHLVRAVYPRLAILFFLPPRVNELAFVTALLGHTTSNEDGETDPNYSSSLYYMSYKVADANGAVDSREGIKLALDGVEMLNQFKQERERTMADIEVQASDRTKIGVSRATKAAFDDEQRAMGGPTADDAVAMLVRDHQMYRRLVELLDGGSIEDLMAALAEAAEIRLEKETVMDCLNVALADKRRFRGTYEKRSAANATRDYSSMSMDELKNIKALEASRERWKRAVEKIMAYNDAAAIPELRWFINAAAIKALVGGRGAEIGRYLKDQWQAELDQHHANYGLRPGHNHSRKNIRERVLGETDPVEDDEE